MNEPESTAPARLPGGTTDALRLKISLGEGRGEEEGMFVVAIGRSGEDNNMMGLLIAMLRWDRRNTRLTRLRLVGKKDRIAIVMFYIAVLI